MKTMAAAEFKAKCLAVLDQVARDGEPVEIHKRGKPVARLIPAFAGKGRFPQDSLRGSVKTVGDIIAPVVPPEDWEAARE